MNLSKKLTALLLISSVTFASLFTGCGKNPDSQLCKNVLSQSYNYEMTIANLNIYEINQKAAKAFEEIQSDGSFADIDYQSHEQTNWKPDGHLVNIKNLCISYVNPKGKFYKNHEAYTKIINGLNLWQNANPTSTNWYMQEISSPQKLGCILVLMRFGEEKVPEETENAILERMKETGGNPKKWTGANKADIALHYVYRGALTGDESLISFAAKQAYSTLEYTKKEGFQYDNSYQQHGPQLYITGYGNAIINAVAAIAAATADTKYAMPQEAIDLVRGFINETYIRVGRGKYRLYNTGGRSLSREDSLNFTGDITLYEKLKIIDKENSQLYDAVIDRLSGTKSPDYLVEQKHTHYWRSDYTLHTVPDFTFDVRTVSNRTYRNENGNKENLKGYFLADGAYSIYVDGDEYYNIFPVWDFSLIPGTTTPHVKDIPLPHEWGTYGSGAFSGGVSDGQCGISAYAYNDKDFSVNTSANKSYFMIDNMIICIETGINSSNPNEIMTTLNQCLSAENAIAIDKNGNLKTIENGKADLTGYKGIYHDKVGYAFLDDNKISVNKQIQQGKWTDINTSSSNQDLIEKEVFTLTINHGVKPSGESYKYVLLPGINSADELKNYNTENIKTVSETDIHAVKLADSETVYGVFFKAGTLEMDSIKITVDKPCSIILTESSLYISNPDQTVSKINVTIEKNDNKKSVKAKLFSGRDKYAGKTVKCDL